MKTTLFLLGFFAAGLVCCGGDESLVVGEERHGSESGTGGVGRAGGGASSGGRSGRPNGGSDSGARGGSGFSGAGDGNPGPGPDCMRMARDYRDALMNAQICMLNAPEACTLPMPDALFSCCTTFVNRARDRDVNFMNYLISASASCPRMCQPGCPSPSGGVCMNDTNLNPPRPHCFPTF